MNAVRVVTGSDANKAAFVQYLSAYRAIYPLLRCGWANAARVLEILAYDDTNRTAIARAGAIPLLVETLCNGSDKGMAIAAGALMCLLLNDDNKVAIAQADATYPLVALLRGGSHAGRRKGARVPGILAYNNTNRATIITLGVEEI